MSTQHSHTEGTSEKNLFITMLLNFLITISAKSVMARQHRGIPRILATALVLILFLSIGFAQQSKKAQIISISNTALRIDLVDPTGDLVSLIDKTAKMNFLSAAGGIHSLWQIDMLPGYEPATITPAMAKTFKWEHPDGRSNEVKLIWEDFALPYSRPLKVEVTVVLDPKKPMSYWSIALDKPGELHIEKVRFPQIPSITKQPEERLAVPLWMGQITKTPRQLITGEGNPDKRLEWPYPGAMSMQCLAFYREDGPGLYLSCDDTSAFRKAFAFWGDSESQVNYEVLHYPENESSLQTSYVPSYRVVVGTFKGDWITVAERYREWGTKQPWAVRSRLNRGVVPEWLLKTSLWVWNRGKSPVVLDPAIDLQKELKLPVSVFWHWWHGCSYDAGFPEYLPPREGTDQFKTALSSAQKSGIHAIVYMNQRLWGMTTKSWLEKGAERFAVKGLDGKVRPEIYNTYTQEACATMCMATPFWRNTYASVAEEALRDLNVDGIYMDQACSSLLCYDPTHNHPLGGGKFWMNGFRLMSNDIRERTRAVKNTLLAGEGVGEAWLPYLDLMLTLQVSKERYARPNDGWDVIPFFQSVYHAYGVTYGNYSSLIVPPYDELWPPEYAPNDPLKLLDRKYATQYYMEQVRTVLWGNQPTIANYRPFQRTERSDEISFLMKLTRVRELGTKYLLYGTFLRPPQFSVSEMSFPISRLSIYAGRKGKTVQLPKNNPAGVMMEKKTTFGVGQLSDDGIEDTVKDNRESSFKSTSSPVVVGTWLAKNGDVGIALANVGSTTLPLRFNVRQYGFKGGERIWLIQETGKTNYGKVGVDGQVSIEVPSREAYIIELLK